MARVRRPQWSRPSNWSVRAAMFRLADFTCQRCGYRPPDELIPAEYDGRLTVGALVIDHVDPLWNDGSTQWPNLQVLCSTCNGRKA